MSFIGPALSTHHLTAAVISAAASYYEARAAQASATRQRDTWPLSAGIIPYPRQTTACTYCTRTHDRESCPGCGAPKSWSNNSERNQRMKIGTFGMEDSSPSSSSETNPNDQPDDSTPDTKDLGGNKSWKGMDDSSPCSSAGNGSESGMTGGNRVCD